MEVRINNTNLEPISEAKARHKVSWYVNELFLPANHYGWQEFPDVANILDLCKVHPGLATEYFTVEDTGEKVTPLEALIRNKASISVIELFCKLFPLALRTGNSRGDIPLHVACEELLYGEYGIMLVSSLATCYPEGTRAFGSHGGLPLHKLLARYSVTALSVANQTPRDVELLLQLFPESTAIIGTELGGLDPLHYVLSHRFHPAMANTIVAHFPREVTHFSFEASLAGGEECLAVSFAEAIATFMPQLKHLVFRPKVLATDNECSLNAWSKIVARLAECPLLRHLELEIPRSLFLRKMDEACDIFATTLPKLSTVKVLFLSTPRDTSHKKPEFDVSIPLTDLVASGSDLEDLIVKEGVFMDPEPILRALAGRSSGLKTLEICSCAKGHEDVTDTLSALIRSNGALQSLFLKDITYRRPPILQALAHNTHLKSLSLPNLTSAATTPTSLGSELSCPMFDGDLNLLSTVLQYYNSTLESLSCSDCSDADSGGERGDEYKRIQFYLRLNRLGRGRTRHENASPRELLYVLDKVISGDVTLPHRKLEQTSLCYGLLHEVPSQWATCYVSKQA
jgi:hypothetical protein